MAQSLIVHSFCAGHLTATLFNAVGALYASTLFLGIVNSISVQPTIAAERGVYYREQPAGYYAVFPW